MANQQKTKRHHFVPRCYLKNFILNVNLYILDIQKIVNGIPHNVKPIQPAGICYIEDYYKIPVDQRNEQFKLDGLDELFVESIALKVLEDKYDKQLYPKLISQDILLFGDACELSDFILQLKFRNPFHFKNMEAIKSETIDEAMNSISKKAFGKGHPYSNIPLNVQHIIIDKVKQEAKQNPLFGKQVQLSRLAEGSEDNPESKKKLRRELMNAGWQMFQSPKNGPYFITSDNPGFATDKNNLNYNTKFLDGFTFYFPISATLCLVISDAEKDNCFDRNLPSKTIRRVNINKDSVIVINNHAIQKVTKLLIASDDWYLSQIAEINRGMHTSI